MFFRKKKLICKHSDALLSRGYLSWVRNSLPEQWKCKVDHRLFKGTCVLLVWFWVSGICKRFFNMGFHLLL